ncbi:MAG: alpha-mannosidase, partial [Lactococcus sp.]|nr:alpha-mannosidase [Lactococcus sp.]
MIKKVHVVPHSHWDREWYFTTSRSKLYLMHNLQKVLALLSADKGYAHFVLDGQASLLDDYLAWRPEDQATIEKLVKAGKLIVGPWYTQTDQLVISGESIVRNMQYGMAI